MIAGFFLAIALVLLVLGAPVFAVIGLSAAVLLLLEGASLASIAQIMLDQMNSGAFASLPFFVIAAFFLERGGVVSAFVRMSLAWLGQSRGGLGYVVIATAAGFSALSGSSVATAMAIGSAMAPTMVQRGYPRPFSMGLIGGAGTLGILIPPSLAFVLYGLVTNTSIPKLFLAGVIPGMVQVFLLAAYVWLTRRHLPLGEKASIRERWLASVRAGPALIGAIGLLTLTVSGVVTLTEAAALTALFAIGAALWLFKGLGWRKVLPTMADSLGAAGRILLIICASTLMSHWLMSSGKLAALTELIETSSITRWQFLALVTIVLVLLGAVLEGVSLILLVAPIAAPLLASQGIHPVHFGVIMVVAIEIGMLTPPVGMNLFVLSGLAGATAAEVIRGVAPVVAIMAGFLLLVTFFPDLALWLPGALFG